MEVTKEILALDKMIMNFSNVEIMDSFVILEENLFKNELNRKAFKLLKWGYKKNKNINEILSYEEETSNLFIKIMDEIKTTVYEPFKIIEGIKENHYKSTFEVLLRKSISEIQENELSESINKTINEILNISKETNLVDEDYIFDNKQIAENFYNKYEDEDRKKPLSSGIDDLDYIIKFHKKEVYTIAARPGSGKTAFSLAILKNFCNNDNYGIFFSLEMSEEQITNRIIASMSKVDLNSIDDGSFLGDKEKDAKVEQAIARLTTDSLKFKIVDKAGMRIEEIIGIAKKINKDKKIDFIILDHVGLIRPSQREEKRIMIDNAYKEFKRIAKDLNLPVIVLSQMNRKIDDKTDKIPLLSHLKDSGSIEEDSAGVLMLNNPFVSAETEEEKLLKKDILEVYIRKNRFGKLGKVDLHYKMSTQYIGGI